jgi:hypothetical protein
MPTTKSVVDPPAPTAAAAQPAATTTQVPISSLNAAVALPTPPPAPLPTPAPLIAAPVPELGTIAPLSPSVTSTTEGSGGSSGVSLPGGGHEGLQACMEFWDRGTHMSKTEWKASCQRSIKRMDSVKVDGPMPKWLMRK